MIRANSRVFLSVAALALAWTPAAAFAQDDPRPTRVTREIPRLANAASFTEQAASRFGADAAARFAASPVYVLAPSSLTDAEAAEFARRFRATPDGYFSAIRREGYDIVFNGTVSAAVAPELSKIVRSEQGEDILYETAEGMSQASFTRLGGDYLLEFVCDTAPEGGAFDEEAGEQTCVTEAEVIGLVNALRPVGGPI